MSKVHPIASGQRVGCLVTIKSVRRAGRTKWECRCVCGGIVAVLTESLRRYRYERCPCSIGRGLSRTRERRCYDGILKRIYSPSDKRYYRYGGRGITVCDLWRKSFAAFMKDMGPCPSPKHSIDRINNDGNYEPSNCRWATQKEQARNRRSSRLVAFRGEVKTLAEWCEMAGQDYRMIHLRLKRGWSLERALATPARITKLTDPTGDSGDPVGSTGQIITF